MSCSIDRTDMAARVSAAGMHLPRLGFPVRRCVRARVIRFITAARRRGYDIDWFRDALNAKRLEPCIPGRRSRNEPVRYDKRGYRRRSRIEIIFGRLNDWRRVANRYDRCPTAFLSAGTLATTVPQHLASRRLYTGSNAPSL